MSATSQNATSAQTQTQTANEAPGFKWLVAVVLGCCYTLSYIDRQIISLLIDPIKLSFGLSDTQVGLMQGLSFSLFYVAASLPLAWFADRGHRAAVISFCLAGWSTMTMLCGLAQSYAQLFLARIGVAFGEAGLPPAALTTIADLFDPRRLALPTAIFMLAPFIGGGLSLLGGGALYAATESWTIPSLPGIGVLERWQLVFIIVGAPGAPLAFFVYWMIRRAGRARAAQRQSFSESLGFIRKRWRFTMFYMLAMGLSMTLMSAYVTWLPAAVMRSKGIDEQTIGVLFGPIYLIAGAAGTLGAGMIIARISANDPVGTILKFMRACALLLLPVGIIGPLAGSLWLELALMGMCILLISSIASVSSLPFQYVAPMHLRAQSIAVLALISALLGTGSGPIVAGVLSDVLSFVDQPLSWALTLIAGVTMPIVFALLHFVALYHKKARIDLEAGTLMGTNAALANEA